MPRHPFALAKCWLVIRRPGNLSFRRFQRVATGSKFGDSTHEECVSQIEPNRNPISRTPDFELCRKYFLAHLRCDRRTATVVRSESPPFRAIGAHRWVTQCGICPNLLRYSRRRAAWAKLETVAVLRRTPRKRASGIRKRSARGGWATNLYGRREQLAELRLLIGERNWAIGCLTRPDAGRVVEKY